MENLLEMAKSDGKTRNFLHECYMADPDHVGTGFGRWLEENKEVLPVYLECMEQIEGSVGYLQEGFMLARMEGEDTSREIGYIPEASKLLFNDRDMAKLDTDEGYKDAFLVVKDKVISEIVNKSIKGEKINLGDRATFDTFNDLLIGITADGATVSMSDKIMVNMGKPAVDLIIDLFGKDSVDYTKKANLRVIVKSFGRALIQYIKKYAEEDSTGRHKSLSKIIRDGRWDYSESDVESDIDNFAKYAFLNAIGARTVNKQLKNDKSIDNGPTVDQSSAEQTNDESYESIDSGSNIEQYINELKKILNTELSSYDKVKEIVYCLVDAYKAGSDDETISNIYVDKGAEDYSEVGAVINMVFDYIDNNPSVDEVKLKQKMDAEINIKYRKNIKEAINNSDILNNDEKRVAIDVLNRQTHDNVRFERFMRWFRENPKALAIKLLSDEKNSITHDTTADENKFAKLGTERQQKLNRDIEALTGKILYGFNNIEQTLAILKSDNGFIERLIEECKAYERIDRKLLKNQVIDMNDIILKTEYVNDPCGKNNLGNAIMTYIFGIGTNSVLKHNRLKKCVIDSIKDYENNPEGNLKEIVYNRMVNSEWIKSTERHIKNLIRSGYKFAEFNQGWKQEQMRKEDDTFKKEAYMYMLSTADLLA